MSVYLVPWNPSINLLEEANRLYDEAGTFDCISKGDLVAVKLHVGELGNPYYVQLPDTHMGLASLRFFAHCSSLLQVTGFWMPSMKYQNN